LAHLIFDLDGTLVDSAPGILDTLRQAVRNVLPELNFDPDAFRIGPPVNVMLRQALPEVANEALATIESVFRSIYDSQGWQLSIAYPGVRNTLASLRRAGHHLYLATNKPSLPTGQILKNLDLQDFFTAVICSDTTQAAYTSKAAMLRALIVQHGLAQDMVVYIGDSLLDLQASMGAGVKFIGVKYGYGNFDSSISDLIVVSSISDLQAFFCT